MKYIAILFCVLGLTIAGCGGDKKTEASATKTGVTKTGATKTAPGATKTTGATKTP